MAGSFHEGNGGSCCASCARVRCYVRLCASCDPRVPHGNSCRDRCPSGTGEDGAQSSGSGSGGDAPVESLFPFDISFQLSVCASAGILLFYEPLRHALARLGKIPPRICEGCALSTAAQVLVLPIILYNFHSFPLYFIPANLIVVPLLEWVIIGGLLAALSSFLLMPLAGGILQFANYFLWAALRLNGFISSLPEASFEAGSLSLAEGICII